MRIKIFQFLSIVLFILSCILVFMTEKYILWGTLSLIWSGIFYLISQVFDYIIIIERKKNET